MKLSIIVPVYNMAGDNKLQFCLESLLSQNLDEYEKDAGFMLVYADIDDAIKTNGEYKSECYFNEVMIGRDKRVLEMIREEILKKGLN